MERSQETLKKIVEIFNTGDFSTVDSIFSAEYIDHQNDNEREPDVKNDGPEEFKQVVTGARKSLPNLNVSIEDMFSENNKVVGRLQWHSTTPSGKKIDRETIDILRLADGKVVEHWGAQTWTSETNSQ